MKIFISHSSRDIDIYNELAEALKEKGYTIFNVNEVNVGESVIEKIKFALNDSDVLIAIITENFLNSSWAQAELSSAILSTNNIRVLPVVVGDVFVPNFLIQFQYRKVDSAKEITRYWSIKED
jgi:histidyl-tRNA synthetase